MDANKQPAKSRFTWVNGSLELVREYAETFVVLLYIVTGLATFLILFGFIEDAQKFNRAIGALAFAYSALALVVFTNRGVKHQLASNKKGRK